MVQNTDIWSRVFKQLMTSKAIHLWEYGFYVMKEMLEIVTYVKLIFNLCFILFFVKPYSYIQHLYNYSMFILQLFIDRLGYYKVEPDDQTWAQFFLS